MFLGVSFITIVNCYGQEGYDQFFDFMLGPYSIGYKVEGHIDNSRTFNRKFDYFGNRNIQNNRQILMHIWYPAQITESENRILYKNYIEKSAINAKGGIPNIEDIEETFLRFREQLLARNIDSNFIGSFLEIKTNAFWNANNTLGKFPLILYAPSINSNPYENIVLIEYLVSNGYVVVSSPSIGNGSLEVTRDISGAETQLRDLEYLLRESWDLPNVDNTHIFTIGFSWGGMTNVLLAMQNSNIEGVVSLDGALGFEEYYKIGRSFSCFNPNNMAASYLGFIPSSEIRTRFFIDFLKYCDATLIQVNRITHKDFSSDAILKKLFFQVGSGIKDKAYLCKFYSKMCETILCFFNKTISPRVEKQRTDLTISMSSMGNDIMIESKRKLPLPPTEHEFLNIIRTKGAEMAENIFNEIRLKDSTAIFFSEKSMISFAYEYGPERANDLITILKMNNEVYPNSTETLIWLAQAHMAINEKEEARKYLNNVLKIEPGNQKVQKLLFIINGN